jgi:putative transposase
MILSHKIEILPNDEQKIQLVKACGCARFAYNWGLNRWNEMYQAWKGNNTLPKPNANLIKKEFNSIKEKEYPWIYDSPKDANQQPFANLGKAFKAFFDKTRKYPVKKKKGKRDSFYISNDMFRLDDNHIKLPLIGKVKLTEKLRFEGKIMSCTVSRQADSWFASLNVDVGEYKKPRKSNNKIGIDFGIKTLITDQNGNEIQSPKPLKTNLRKLKRLSKRLSKKKEGSKNREKAKIKLSKLHKRISDIRKDFTNKLTTQICNENQVIIIEDLCVKSWSKMFGKSGTDGCVGEIIRQLSYKKEIYGNILHKIDRWFPSSQICSCCGNRKLDLKLCDREYHCSNCGLKINRDWNASKNIYTVGLTEIDACGYLASREEKSTLSRVDETRILTCNNCVV